MERWRDRRPARVPAEVALSRRGTHLMPVVRLPEDFVPPSAPFTLGGIVQGTDQGGDSIPAFLEPCGYLLTPDQVALIRADD